MKKKIKVQGVKDKEIWTSSGTSERIQRCLLINLSKSSRKIKSSSKQVWENTTMEKEKQWWSNHKRHKKNKLIFNKDLLLHRSSINKWFPKKIKNKKSSNKPNKPTRSTSKKFKFSKIKSNRSAWSKISFKLNSKLSIAKTNKPDKQQKNR